MTTPITSVCKVCGKRFKNKDWHVGIENKWCFTCIVKLKILRDRSTIQEGPLWASIKPREAQIMGIRTGVARENMEPATLEYTAKMFGVTRERIRQIEAKVHETIRQFK